MPSFFLLPAVIPEQTPVNDHLETCMDEIAIHLELAERLDGLASAGKHTEDVEADLKENC